MNAYGSGGRKSGLFQSALAGLCLAVSTTSLTFGESQSAPTAKELFQLYRARQFDVVARGLEHITDWQRFLSDVRSQSAGWPAAVAASFALESSAEVLRPSQPLTWLQAKELLEVGCRIVAQSQISGTFGHQWHLAAISMYEGFGSELPAAFAGAPLQRQHLVEHAVDRFPNDARFRLARLREHERAVYHYLFVNRVRAEGPKPGPNSAMVAASGALQMSRMGDLFEALRPETSVHAEATIRAAFWRLMSGRAGDATRLLDDFERSSDASDPWYGYLAHLFRGRLLAGQGDHNGAAASYRRALTVLPGDAARSGLAASLFVIDRREEAATVVQEMLMSPQPERDPWLWHAFGDHRFWQERRQALRKHWQ